MLFVVIRQAYRARRLRICCWNRLLITNSSTQWMSLEYLPDELGDPSAKHPTITVGCRGLGSNQPHRQ